MKYTVTLKDETKVEVHADKAVTTMPQGSGIGLVCFMRGADVVACFNVDTLAYFVREDVKREGFIWTHWPTLYDWPTLQERM